MYIKAFSTLLNFAYDSQDDHLQMPPWIISKKPEVVNHFFSTERIRHHFGLFEQIIYSNHWSMYYAGDHVNLPFKYDIKTFNDYGRVYHGIIEGLAKAMWFVKDNSIQVESTLMIFEVAEKNQQLARNRSVNAYVNSEGGVSTVKFNINDIETALLTYNKIVSFTTPFETIVSSSSPIQDDVYSHAGFTNIPYTNEINRIQRSLMMIDRARLTSFLPLKISFYIASLECLFTSASSSSEVTHKVSERVAWYVGGDAVTKKNTFESIKQGYDIRSKYFHGQGLGSKNSQQSYLIERAVYMDDISRSILNKVIFHDTEIFLGTDKVFEQYMKDLVFGN